MVPGYQQKDMATAGRCKAWGGFGSVKGYFTRNHPSALPQYIMYMAHGKSEEAARQAIVTKAEFRSCKLPFLQRAL